MFAKRNVSEVLTYKNREFIPTPLFHVMTFIMRLVDLFGGFSDKNFCLLDLKEGQTVIDYGCGPARYIKKASMVVGDTGKVIATDIHPLAIKKVKQKIVEHKLSNVETILCNGYDTEIESEIADVIYTLDVFHMIEKPNVFLAELTRLIKENGKIIIADGHQPRSSTLKKIKECNLLQVIDQNKLHVVCQKIK